MFRRIGESTERMPTKASGWVKALWRGAIVPFFGLMAAAFVLAFVLLLGPLAELWAITAIDTRHVTRSDHYFVRNTLYL
jgi:hypothetical protein